jgi:membrane-associated phospholipid phosphatase
LKQIVYKLQTFSLPGKFSNRMQSASWSFQQKKLLVILFFSSSLFSFSASAQSPVPSLLGSTPNRMAVSGCILPTKLQCDGLPPEASLTGLDSSALLSPSLDQSGSGPQPASSESLPRRIAVRLLRDQASIYAAPFHRSSVKWDVFVLAGTAALIASDKQIETHISHDNVDISRNISNGAIYGTGAIAGSIWLTGLVTHNDHAKETGVLTTEALVNALPVYVGLQLIAGRERPDEGLGHGRFLQNHWINSSFPGGHAMFAWTMATVVAHEYPHPWVKVLMYTAATAVSASRFMGREHFASDIAVGTIFGYFIGRHVFNMHCNPEFSEQCPH